MCALGSIVLVQIEGDLMYLEFDHAVQREYVNRGPEHRLGHRHGHLHMHVLPVPLEVRVLLHLHHPTTTIDKGSGRGEVKQSICLMWTCRAPRRVNLKAPPQRFVLCPRRTRMWR